MLPSLSGQGIYNAAKTSVARGRYYGTKYASCFLFHRVSYFDGMYVVSTVEHSSGVRMIVRVRLQGRAGQSRAKKGRVNLRAWRGAR